MDNKLQSRAFKNLSSMDLSALTKQFLKIKHNQDYHFFKNTIGLGEYASNTYAILLASKKALSASECSFVTEHPRTKTHGVLKWLEENGLVESIGSRPALFKAVPPKKALVNFIKNEKQKIAEMEGKLKQIASAIENAK